MGMRQPAVSDEQIIAALLANHSIGKAAEAVGMNPRTIYKRMGTPTFKAAYSAARADLVRQAVADLNGQMALAVATLVEIMTDAEAPAGARVQAARLLMDNAAKFSDRVADADRMTGDLLQAPFKF